MVALTLWVNVASAQQGGGDTTPPAGGGPGSAVDRGRAAAEAFREGSVAADELRWGDAERAFARAHAVSGLPQALYMRGVALRALDRHVEARDVFRAVVAAFEADAALLAENADIAAEARDLAAQSERRIARLDISTLDPASTLRIDGRVIAVNAPRTSVEVDAGAHTVVVERDGYDTFVWTGEAPPTARVSVEVVMSSLVAEMPDPRPVRRRRALVGTIVSLVVVAAVGAAVGVRLANDVEQVAPETSVVLTVP